jgi:septum formation protein
LTAAEHLGTPQAMPSRLPLVLASGSPRRRALLTGAGVRFEVEPADVVERRGRGERPEAFATRLARDKARAVAQRLGPRPPRLVLGADTIVVLDGDVLGKPDDVEHAAALLGRLAGRTHRVITAVAVVETDGGRTRDTRVESRVTLRRASAREIRDYAAGGEPLDKAGAYALQGEGRRFVQKVEGSESNVIGLPVEETLALLRRAGWSGDP